MYKRCELAVRSLPFVVTQQCSNPSRESAEREVQSRPLVILDPFPSPSGKGSEEREVQSRQP